MDSTLYLYADEVSLEVLAGPAEKVMLVGGDFGYGNFGDILQQINTATLHRAQGRYLPVAVMAANAVGDAELPRFVRETYGVAAVVFVSEVPLQLPAWGGLEQVRAMRNVGAMHLYGGGFLNDKWGPFVLGVVEYLVRALRPTVYVISGQQITDPFQHAVGRHADAHRPALFGVRDTVSQALMSRIGAAPELSFDDATEALQRLSRALHLRRAPGLLMQLNVSYYTDNVAWGGTLRDELTALAEHDSARAGVTLLQAFQDRRAEVVDTRESIKELERMFPFVDSRLVELAALAYAPHDRLARPLEGDVGYSCSYHVALWMQLAGIPCWLRGSNDFYRQKRQALQVTQELPDFLREPRVADHRENLELRAAWQERLRGVLADAPQANHATNLAPRVRGSLSPWPCKEDLSVLRRRAVTQGERAEKAEEGLAQANDRLAAARASMNATAADAAEERARVLALNAQVTHLGALVHAHRARAEEADASLVETRARLVAATARIEQLEAEAQTQRQAQEELQSYVEERNAVITELAGRADGLLAQLDAVLASRSWKVTRPLREIASLRSRLGRHPKG